MNMKKIVIAMILIAAVGIGFYLVKSYRENAIYRNPGFACGNGRLEATEINISAKLAGRIESIDVNEGDMVKKGQLLAKMQTNTLEAELAQAKAKHAQAVTAEAGAVANIGVRQSELEAAKAVVLQKESSLDGARKRYERAQKLLKDSAMSRQTFENDETIYLTAKAELAAAKANVKQAEAAISAAKASAEGEKANIKAAEADIARIQADIDDSKLTAPLGGRIQYRISEPGEVLNAGGRVLNLVDLTDVYMTFYLPEAVAGKVKLGADVRIVLDALPTVPIPAKISYVASVAQFTPKTVETKIERQKLMFRIKARISPELLQKYVEYVKTGLPGVAWVQLDPNAKWPEQLMLLKEKGKTLEKAEK
ncbi:MAG: efflux RND transporter periplasmic adaptor subunit [Lentisphaeria bacterium]|nr:efflux RND transporter periplasmic adaptor subunit [Lentisphaeria bacterium]MBO5765313.1 efflux RND transporter periplasmic adaptor subunit [Lentisphaeria bacterium]MBO5990514.1 efflux RND transporter periplasmic adaptor subunit [Lentisphaeria bacterium]MBO7154123.1 efflux RND transporter periplasmic adaptor subunit [Lentisphaeria bacterium]